jgi:SMP-30/Gluconolactonase/LRE-like region
MRLQSDVSRRHMLAISAAAGSLAIGSSFRRASAQGAKRIEQLDPSLDKIIDTSQPVRELASGLGGALGPAEGPVWWKEGGYLLFSDIHNNRRMKYTPGQGVTVFKEPTNRANGLTRDLQGRLVACEHDTRRVTRQELDGSITASRAAVSIGPMTSSSSPTAASISPTRTATSSPSNGTSLLPACTASAPTSAP